MMKKPRPAAAWHCRDQLATIVVVCYLIQIKSLHTHGAVVRPTVFSNIPPTQQQQQQQQPQQAQQPQPQQQPPQLSASSLAQQQEYQHQANFANVEQHKTEGAHTQKINPLKSRFCTGPNNQRLDHSLGLQSGAVDDLSLSASSFSNEQVRPHLARLNQNSLGGAWCPGKPISPSTFGQEWIQVKFNRSFVVNAIETQGRFALGSGKEFVPSYQIVYSRNNGLTWHKWRDFRGYSLLRANEDVNTVVRNELSPPIVGANVIRILPHSPYLRTVCLRFELYGCQYDEGAPIAYATNDGVVEPRWGHLIDYTYDGLRHRNGPLSGGLGQLVDGVKGPDNFSLNNGFEWVGWKSMNGDVVIEFTFKTLRNFTGALFHSNNLFSSGVEVFQSVDVHYGIDINLSMEAIKDSLHERERRQQLLASSGITGGVLSRSARQLSDDQQQQQLPTPTTSTLWSADVLSIEYEPDKKAESSRPVTVHLKQRVANKLRFVLKFASKWILISEVEFLSHPVELMSLASLNEQLTPQLMADLKLAKTYDQYVAILREHQLKRIAAEQYSTMGDVGGSSTLATSTLSTPSEQEIPALSDQQTSSTNNEQQEQPASNPMLSNQPPYPSPGNYMPAPSFEQPLMPPPLQPQPQPSDKNMMMTSENNNNTRRTIGVATIISFVFAAILVFACVLFAISSYRLRYRSPRHKSGAGTPNKAAFMGSVFVNGSSSSSAGGDSSAGSMHHSNNFRGQAHMTLGHDNHEQIRADNHYNPLFATRASDNSLKKPTGPLKTLRKLATLSTRANNANNSKQAGLLFSNQHNVPIEQQQQQNQLLVSLNKSTGKSQAINTQLIVGLNQANPLAHQQIYNQQQAIYNPYNSNSISLTSSSTLNGNGNNQQTGEYSLVADYATPDLQPIIQTTGQTHFQHQLTGQQPMNRQMFRCSTRATQHGHMEHNYEQINSDLASNTLHHHHHQRTLSSHQQQALCGQQAFNSMTLISNRATNKQQHQQQQQAESSHYYYADTEAAKMCLGK